MSDENEDDALGSFLHKFTLRDEDGVVTLVSRYPRAGNERKKPQNRDYVDVEIDEINQVENAITKAIDLRM